MLACCMLQWLGYRHRSVEDLKYEYTHAMYAHVSVPVIGPLNDTTQGALSANEPVTLPYSHRIALGADEQ